MSETRVTRRILASPAVVYAALVDASAVQQWMVPDGMTSHVHTFDASVGGDFRISLTYDAPSGAGKTDPQTDTFHGRFLRLVPGAEVVQTVEFESDDPAMSGAMTITYTLTQVPGGTELRGTHAGLPPGVAPADNELGWRLSLDKLARLVEQDAHDWCDERGDEIPSDDVLVMTAAADRFDSLADTAELMGDDDGARRFRDSAGELRAQAMSLLDE